MDDGLCRGPSVLTEIHRLNTRRAARQNTAVTKAADQRLLMNFVCPSILTISLQRTPARKGESHRLLGLLQLRPTPSFQKPNVLGLGEFRLHRLWRTTND